MNRVLWIWLPDWPLQRLAAARPELSAIEAHDLAADRAALVELAQWCERFSPAVAIESAECPDGLALDVTGLGPLFGGEAALAERVVREFRERGLSVCVAIADTLGAAWAAAKWRVTSDKWQVASGKQMSVSPSASSPLAPNLPPATCHLPLPCIIPPGGSLSVLAPLPVAALRLPEETVDLLAAVGIRTIEQVAALPRASLSTRFGPQLLKHLDWATGATSELLVPHRAAPQLAAEWAFESPVDSAEAIEQVLEELIRRVSKPLAARDEGALSFVCRIDCADRERIALPVGLFRPSASPKHLWELLRLRLETIRLAAPVAALGIEVTVADRIAHEQQDLFAPDRSRDVPRHLAALVERLSSRLGREAVVRPCLLPDAQPEYASVDLPWTGVRGSGKWQVADAKTSLTAKKNRLWKGGQSPFSPRHPHPGPLPSREREKSKTASGGSCVQLGVRPLWLADRPVPISVISVVPAGPPAQFHFDGVDYRIARSWGPERIETGWWRAGNRGSASGTPARPSPESRVPNPAFGIRRDYYRIETTSGHRFWLFRRLADTRWFLHGEFG